jgi:alkylated DNA repair dioxygenase AlkB
MKQRELFPNELPRGFSYREAFLSHDEERQLVRIIEDLPLQEAQYKEFTARRRTLSYGSSYDFATNTSLPAPEIPEFLFVLREKVAHWCAIPADRFVHALIAEYRPGTPLGWHRDVPEFELIAGVSLLGSCRLRLRPYPWSPQKRSERLFVELAPRSVYVLRGEARWKWQHSVPPVKELRYSITLRTRRWEHTRSEGVPL